MFANVPQVNFGVGVTTIPGFQDQAGAPISTQYYDPAYSGTQLAPNIAATRGTPQTTSNGGYLWTPNLTFNLTMEYTRGRNTLGVQFNNLFGNWYNGVVPIVNPYYQPVATGISGPQTAQNPYVTAFPGRG
jgi:hypothetical protein